MNRFLIACALALLATPALAAWDLSRVAGPYQAPIYGAPVTDANGNPYTPITGYQPGVVFVLPAEKVTPVLQPYAEAVPQGLPVLAGVPSEALVFPDEATAEAALPGYWTPDPPQ